MGDTGFDEFELDGPDAAVVHVGRCDAVGSGIGIGHGDVADSVDGEGVVKTAVIAQDAAMAVRGVFTEADIGDDEEAGEAAAQEADGLDDGALGVVGGGAEGVFDVGAHGHAEENYGFQAFADEGLEVGDYFVDAAAVLVGERGDEGFFLVVVRNEERVYQHGLRVWNQRFGLIWDHDWCGCTLVNCLSACHDLASG